MAALFKAPQVQQAPAPTPIEVKAPVASAPQVEQLDRTAADIMRRRKGMQATVTGAGGLGSTAGSVASKSLLGM